MSVSIASFIKNVAKGLLDGTVLPKRTFYMIRHGQTEDNATGTTSLRRSDLTITGQEEAKGLCNIVEKLFNNPDDCYLVTSSIPRARRTAGFAVPEGWNVHQITDHRLAGHNNGNMAGKADVREWMRIMQADHASSDVDGFKNANSPNGQYFKLNPKESEEKFVKLIGAETFGQFTKRVKKALNFHLKQYPEKIPLFVCHRGVMAITAALLGHDANKFDGDKVYKFTPVENNKWEIESISLENGRLEKRMIASTPIKMVDEMGDNIARA